MSEEVDIEDDEIPEDCACGCNCGFCPCLHTFVLHGIKT
jgi:hypothetical protein